MIQVVKITYISLWHIPNRKILRELALSWFNIHLRISKEYTTNGPTYNLKSP